MKNTRKKKAIMNLESLEARTLFAGADEAFSMECAEMNLADDMLSLAVIAVAMPDAFEGAVEAVDNMISGAAGLANDYVFEPSMDFASDVYKSVSSLAFDYYSHPENFMSDALTLAGQGVELTGGLLEGSGSLVKVVGEGLEGYAEATRHVGRIMIGGAIASAYVDPSMMTMTAVGSLGTAVWGASKVMPYAGAIGSALGGATEYIGSSVSTLGSWIQTTGENLHV